MQEFSGKLRAELHVSVETSASCDAPVLANRVIVPGLVSTIIPVYNRAAMLVQAVESVFAQTYPLIEIIIVDDGSTDETLSTAHSLASTSQDRIRVIRQDNAGPGIARQAGTDAARGEFIQYLDSDDRYLPRKTSVHVELIQSRPNAGIVYGPSYEDAAALNDGRELSIRRTKKVESLLPNILAGKLWHTCAPLYRSVALAEIGAWPEIRQWEDWLFDARAARAGVEVMYCGEPLTVQTHHHGVRLGTLWVSDLSGLRQRAIALREIFDLCCDADSARTSAHDAFADTSFFEMRLMDKHGLKAESASLRRMLRSPLLSSPKVRLYDALQGVVGPSYANRLYEIFHKLRRAK
jgi:GT2 family glycosyltransferase